MIFTSEELHAEVCYAECLLQRAALTFLQVRNEAYPEATESATTEYVRFNLNFLALLLRMKTWSVSSKVESKWGTATKHTSEDVFALISSHLSVVPSFLFPFLKHFFYLSLPCKTLLIGLLSPVSLTESSTQSSSPLGTLMVTTMAILKVVLNWELEPLI